jgi:hypothetical protein
LREALAGAGHGQVTFRRELAGFPGTVHGGAVGALFQRATSPETPIVLSLSLAHGVPTEAPLRLVAESQGVIPRLALWRDDRELASATLAREPGGADLAGSVFRTFQARTHPAGETPGTATCLACGSANPLGLRVRFEVTDRLLWRLYTPSQAYDAGHGQAHPALATIMLDELGWWLGALAQGECGVTTEVRITLHRGLPFAPLLVVGDRHLVQPAEDARYCRAPGFILTPDGELLAAAVVTFAGSRAYTRRLVGPFLETTDSETLFRLFPSARTLAKGRPGTVDP